MADADIGDFILDDIFDATDAGPLDDDVLDIFDVDAEDAATNDAAAYSTAATASSAQQEEEEQQQLPEQQQQQQAVVASSTKAKPAWHRPGPGRGKKGRKRDNVQRAWKLQLNSSGNRRGLQDQAARMRARKAFFNTFLFARPK